MSDDEKDDDLHDELFWEDMPRAARLVVYEHLRAVIASHRKDSAMASLLRDVALKGSPDSGPNPVEVLHEVAGTAFVVALNTLEASDEELCPDCGTYHDEGYVHVPSTNPKDLS